jgi:ribosome-binding protein aMBF1 (putative translation factor)
MKRLRNKNFVKELMKNKKFKEEYDALAPEFELLEKMLKARASSGLTQNQVARKMRTTASVIGRLETGGGTKHHSPSLKTLERYASAIGCKLKINFVPVSKKAS